MIESVQYHEDKKINTSQTLRRVGSDIRDGPY